MRCQQRSFRLRQLPLERLLGLQVLLLQLMQLHCLHGRAVVLSLMHGYPHQTRHCVYLSYKEASGTRALIHANVTRKSEIQSTSYWHAIGVKYSSAIIDHSETLRAHNGMFCGALEGKVSRQAERWRIGLALLLLSRPIVHKALVHILHT